jgi:hypothetical protein
MELTLYFAFDPRILIKDEGNCGIEVVLTILRTT